jgi:hypothetical protein
LRAGFAKVATAADLGSVGCGRLCCLGSPAGVALEPCSILGHSNPRVTQGNSAVTQGNPGYGNQGYMQGCRRVTQDSAQQMVLLGVTQGSLMVTLGLSWTTLGHGNPGLPAGLPQGYAGFCATNGVTWSYPGFLKGYLWVIRGYPGLW